MNKSKFLKRSLAAILAILMVVAMVPSALAAQVVNESVPTARVFNDPGYLISVGGDRAVWDADNGAYKVSTTFNEGEGVPANFKASMIEVDRNTVTVKEVDEVLGATVADLDSSKATQSVDSFGVGTYTYTLVAVVTDANGDTISTNEYKLIIDLTMKTKSSDATIKAVKSVKLPYAVSAKYDNAKNTIDIVMALNKKNEYNATNGMSALTVKDIFVPTSDTARTVAYVGSNNNDGKGTVTVTAENGDTKVYAVSFTEETAFDTFKIGDFEGKAIATDPKKIIIDLPYEYYDSANTKIDATKLEELEKLFATWTVPTGSKVYIDGVADSNIKESGKVKLLFNTNNTSNVISTTSSSDDNELLIGTESKYIAVKSDTIVKVKTKKSGDTPVEVEVYLRVPRKNPDAELTGIQIIKGDGDITDPAATDYTQYKAIDKGSRNITIDLPTTMKKADTDLYIHVWGAKNSKIELAEGRVVNEGTPADANAFKNDDDVDSLELSTDKSSDTAINVSKPITLKVVSEDTKTTLLYNVTVNDTNGGSASLTSLKVVNAKGEDVGATVSSLSKKDITITLPYKYGTGDSGDPKDLVVTASGSSSAKISYTRGAVAGESTAAVYKSSAYSVPAATTSNDAVGTVQTENIDLDIGGHEYTYAAKLTPTQIKENGVDGATADEFEYSIATTETPAKILGAFATDYNANASAKDDWTAAVITEANGDVKVQFTAKALGALSDTHAVQPTGTTGTDGVTGGAAGKTWTPFIKEGVVKDLTCATPASDTITLPLASDSTDASGTNNVFTLRVNNGSANGDNLYVVTLKKGDPSNNAKIESIKITKDANKSDTMVEYGSTVNTRSGKDTSTIKVNELPHAFKTENTIYFSEMKISPEAHVVIDTSEIKFNPADETANAGTIAISSGDSGWSTANNEIVVKVFSEKDWYDTSVVPDNTNLDGTEVATKSYKMSATYAAAGTGSDLTSIASTLNETIKVATASKTITITVPNSYLDDENKKFSLDIKTSPFAKVFGNAVTGGTSVAIIPDEGKADTSDKTEFIVKTDDVDDTIKLFKDSTAITKLIVQSESETNTSDYNVVVKVAPVETSNAIESITVAGKTATKGADGETWDLVLPVDADLVQLVDIKTASKLATVEVDGVPYDAENYYDLGDDLSIKVTAENGEAFTYTLKTVREGINTNTDIADIRAGAYNATRGTGNAWTIQVPEGTDMSNPSLTVRTVVDGAKVTSVNGEAYTDGMTVDLSEGKTLTIVVTALDGTTTGTHTVTAKFGDKKPAEEYHDIPAGGMGEWVTKAINYGLMSNTGANDEGKLTFGPNDRVERKYFALMVARADVMANDATITDKDAADEKLKSLYSGTPAFSDAPANDETVNAALEYCKTNGIISGYEDGTFKPNNYVGRTEAASILVGWLKLPDAGEENTNNFKDWNAIGWAHGKVNSVVKAGVMSGIGDGYFGTGTLTREQTAVILTRAFENLRDSK